MTRFRPIHLLFALCLSLLLAGAAQAQGERSWDPEMRQRMDAEIREHENGARDLGPLIARNQQARNDLLADADALARQAGAMRQRAEYFRVNAERLAWEPRRKEHFERTANELTSSAARHEQLANQHREIARSIENLLRGMEETRNWHIETARRLRDGMSWR